MQQGNNGGCNLVSGLVEGLLSLLNTGLWKIFAGGHVLRGSLDVMAVVEGRGAAKGISGVPRSGDGGGLRDRDRVV
jgi:hypothetical protein